MDWSDEVRARLVREEERLRYKAANLQARGKTVMAAQELVVADDIRAALGEIKHFHTVHKWCHRQPTHGKCCTCQACGLDYDSCRCSLDEQVERAEAAEAEVERLRGLLDDALACDPAIRPVEWVEWRERAALRGER